MVKKKNSLEWLKENGENLSKMDAIKKCSIATGITVGSCMRSWNKLYKKGKKRVKAKLKMAPKGFKGLTGFAKLHDIDSRQKRRDEHSSLLIKNFIDGPLKDQGWYYDSEASRVAGLTSVDWSRHRDSYSDLQVIVNTDKGKRMTWVHPTLVNEARKIAERS